MLPLAAIPTPPFSGLELGPFNLRMYGLVIAIGAYFALRMLVQRYSRIGGDPGIAERAGLLALLGGFLGARIGYVIPRFLGDGGFIERPLEIFAIWQGGLAFFGGLVGGALAVVLYLRSKNVALAGLADAAAPALPLAQAVGRWGNYFNQELFGRPTDLPWALQVDPGPAARAGFPNDTTFHPTFLYESLWNAALVVFILWLDRRDTLRRRGSLFFIYLIGYGVGRGWVEALRVDTVERYLGLSRNNWVAILVVLVGIIGLIVWERRGMAPLRSEPLGAPSLATDEARVDRTDDTATDTAATSPAPSVVGPADEVDPADQVEPGQDPRDGDPSGQNPKTRDLPVQDLPAHDPSGQDLREQTGTGADASGSHKADAPDETAPRSDQTDRDR